MQIIPVRQNERIVIIDILRGWALLGVVLMNYIDYYYLGLNEKSDTFGQVLQGFAAIVFSSKSWTLLSFLFGYGFAVLLENVASKGINPVSFFARRMFWLFVIALINSAFFFGDILKDYAVMGMILLLFYRVSARTAFSICLALLIIVPAVSAYIASFNVTSGFKMLTPYFAYYRSGNIFDVLWFGLIGTYTFEIVWLNYLVTVHIVMMACFFMGLAAQKTGFFSNLTEKKFRVKRMFWGSLSALIALALFTLLLNFLGWRKYYQTGYLLTLSAMLLIVSTICWLFIRGKLSRFFLNMQTIGKMTLTNYLVQNFIGIFLFSGVGFSFSLGRKIHAGYYLLFALIIYVAQIAFSKWWLAKYHYGPVEWVWRQLSYGKRLELRKK